MGFNTVLKISKHQELNVSDLLLANVNHLNLFVFLKKNKLGVLAAVWFSFKK